ncbi:MAG: hypothetical protein KDD91_23785 [Caldilinea sp.]|nr:hypothetical protein [Caldilinea sp.]
MGKGKVRVSNVNSHGIWVTDGSQTKRYDFSDFGVTYSTYNDDAGRKAIAKFKREA